MSSAVPTPASTSSLPDYAELYCLSNFTFLHGASHAEELVARAVQLGYSALAITDECSLAGVVRAHAEAKKAALPLIIGAHFHLHHDDGSAALSLILLASNRNGYGNLAELITLARTRTAKGTYLLTPADLASPVPAQAHLAGMPDCLAILLPAYPGHDAADLDRLHTQAAWMAATFPERAWLGLNLLHRAFDEAHRATVEEVSWQHGLAVVALGHVCMHVRSRKPLHDTLCAIRLNTPVAECGYALAQNAEQHLRARLRLANLYSPDALAETVRIARLCSFSLDQLRYEYPDELVPPGQTPSGYLRAETYIGAHHRFPLGIPAKVQEQLETELQLIGELRYEPYFLTVYDIVRHARSIGILCQGRGSAANSAVCYCLGITEVDPARGNLLFGRFISKERDEPPDIDVDFEHQRREEVIQYIYNKYGRDRAALAAVVISYRPKSALRDSGKALGVDLAIVEKVAKTHHWFDSKDDLVKRLAECGLDPDSPLAQQWATLAQRLLGFPRHLSQHPGGFVIAAGKLSRLVPIENATMADRSVIQWDKDDLEDTLGLLKVDVLALGHAHRDPVVALQFDLQGAAAAGPLLPMQDIPAEDRATYDMICARRDRGRVPDRIARADEHAAAPASRAPFYDLVIEVAIIRPGPIQGGMVHPYLRRRQDPEQPSAIRSVGARAAVLQRTLGVPIFQEQVMQIASGRRRLQLLAKPTSCGALDGGLEAQRRSRAVLRRTICSAGMLAKVAIKPGVRRERSTTRSRASANTDFPNRMPPVSRCWPMPVPGSSATNRPRFYAPCSTASRWVSTAPRNWCRMRAATASRCARRTWPSAAGIPAWSRGRAPSRRCGWGCRCSAACVPSRPRGLKTRAPCAHSTAWPTSRAAPPWTGTTCRCWQAPMPCMAWLVTGARRCGKRWARCPTRTCCAPPHRRKTYRCCMPRAKAKTLSATTARRA